MRFINSVWICECFGQSFWPPIQHFSTSLPAVQAPLQQARGLQDSCTPPGVDNSNRFGKATVTIVVEQAQPLWCFDNAGHTQQACKPAVCGLETRRRIHSVERVLSSQCLNTPEASAPGECMCMQHISNHHHLLVFVRFEWSCPRMPNYALLLLQVPLAGKELLRTTSRSLTARLTPEWTPNLRSPHPPR
jgi:hypothetical protein